MTEHLVNKASIKSLRIGQLFFLAEHNLMTNAVIQSISGLRVGSFGLGSSWRSGSRTWERLILPKQPFSQNKTTISSQHPSCQANICKSWVILRIRAWEGKCQKQYNVTSRCSQIPQSARYFPKIYGKALREFLDDCMGRKPVKSLSVINQNWYHRVCTCYSHTNLCCIQMGTL